MASIQIRVGASLDPGATAVFQPLIAAANRARQQIANAGRGGAADFAGGYRDLPKKAEESFGATTRAAEKAAKEQARAAEWVFQVKQRYLAQEAKATEAALRRSEATAKQLVSSAGRTFGGIVRGGMGLMGSIARGAGVNLDVGSFVQRNVSTQKLATDISNSGYVEGAAGNVGKRQDPKAIIAAAKAAADASATSEESALSGMQKFVGKSTDLQTGMEIVKQMSQLAKAGAGNLDDYMDAAGDVALKLGDIPNKGEAVVAVMKTMARQGQLGASEMRSFSKNVAPLIATAGMFAGGPAKAMSELGAVFQITKQFGGAKGPAQAAVSTSNFVGDLKSASGLKALHAAGLKDSEIFSDKGKTQLRALSEIIPRMLELSKGDLTKVAAEMKGKQSGRVLTGFQKVFQDAGGGAAGKEAVAAKFKEFGGQMSDKQIQESLGAALATTESKAQLFQNRLQAIADQTLPRLLDSVEKLAPAVMTLAEKFADMTAWAAENPMKAVVVALVASVAQAGVGMAISGALQAVITRASVAASAAAGGGGAAAGLGGAALAGVALGSGAVLYGQGKLEGGYEGSADVGSKTADTLDKALAEFKATGVVSPETAKALQAQEAANKQQLALASDTSITKTAALNPFSSVTLAQAGAAEGARDNAGNFQNQNQVIEQLLAASAKHEAAAMALRKGGEATERGGKALEAAARANSGATTGPQPIR